MLSLFPFLTRIFLGFGCEEKISKSLRTSSSSLSKGDPLIIVRFERSVRCINLCA